MSNWTAITEDHLRASGHGAIVDAARATPVGSIDPVDEAIADATADVRSAVSAHNAVDVDETKVPNSLKGLTIRRALLPLMALISLVQTADEQKKAAEDEKRLRSIEDGKSPRKIELPDAPAASGEMQATGVQAEAIDAPPRLTGRERTSGL